LTDAGSTTFGFINVTTNLLANFVDDGSIESTDVAGFEDDFAYYASQSKPVPRSIFCLSG
jgi:hypothetical protein